MCAHPMVAPPSPCVCQASSSPQVARVVRFAAFTQHITRENGVNYDRA